MALLCSIYRIRSVGVDLLEDVANVPGPPLPVACADFLFPVGPGLTYTSIIILQLFSSFQRYYGRLVIEIHFSPLLFRK